MYKRAKLLIIFAACVCCIFLTSLILNARDKERAGKAQEIKEQSLLTEATLRHLPTATPTATPTPQPNKHIEYYKKNIKAELDSVTVKAIYLKLEYKDVYYITAYCPEECGYRVYDDGSDNYPKGWITATGTICHREQEWYKPSTCGINTKVDSYGDLFYIDGRVYIAEDTGLITGNWIDIFLPDYESMSNFGSHYTDVYSVEILESGQAKHFNINDYIERRLTDV